MAKKILIVEDNKNNMRLVKQLIEDAEEYMNEELHLLCAESGPDALELVKDVPLDLVLMDMSLPDMNGNEVTRRLKEYSLLKDVPFIVITAYATEQDKQLFSQTFDDYISKPIDDDIFIKKIEQWIRGK